MDQRHGAETENSMTAFGLLPAFLITAILSIEAPGLAEAAGGAQAKDIGSLRNWLPFLGLSFGVF